MKKLLSMFMAIAIFFSIITVPVTAAPTKGSITITNATKGKTYEVYKIFDAEVLFDSSDNATAVTYKLERTATNAVIFDKLFGVDGKTENDYFEYNINTDEVRKKASAVDTEIIKYLTELIENTPSYANGGSVVADQAEIVFDNLDFGYYLITSSLGAAVTINSNTPNVKVIDKNQEPGEGFDKFVQDGYIQSKDSLGNPLFEADGVTPIMEPNWVKLNSANIGDKVNFKVDFEATNYDGIDKVQYYQVHDEKGSALWVEFSSIKVFVGEKELKRGYYLCYGDPDVLNPGNEWSVLGDWGSATPSIDEAEWYLVHLGYDQFRITIPWLDGHKIVETETTVDGKTHYSYSLTYPGGVEDAEFLYTSPSEVVVTYDAGIEHNASIGGGISGNLFNTAWATWTHGSDIGTTPPQTTETQVFGIALIKKDAKDNKHLAGAEFEVYKDAACTEPLYVIPTGVDGVYIVDSKGTYVDGMSGVNRQPTRLLYAAYLEEYLGPDYENQQKNLVVSQVNGKLIVLGLEEGDYYLKEVKAPTGYNSLTDPYKLVIEPGSSKSFTIFADGDGNVADITAETSTFKEVSYMLTSGTVTNSKGVTLPSTGAEGTIKLITIGTLITIGCAVLLITNKKMSVYRD